MDGKDVKKLLEAGCAHTTGLVAMKVGGAVCLACLKDAIDASNVTAGELVRTTGAQRDRLAADALAALAGAGIATPVEGYVAAPKCLKGDIAELAKQRNEAIDSLSRSEQNYDSLIGVQRATDLALDLEIELVKDLFNRLDKHKSLLADCRTALSQARDMRDTAEKLVTEQRELLTSMKAQRDSRIASEECALRERDQYRAEVIQLEKQIEGIQNRWRLAFEVFTALNPEGGIR